MVRTFFLFMVTVFSSGFNSCEQSSEPQSTVNYETDKVEKLEKKSKVQILGDVLVEMNARARDSEDRDAIERFQTLFIREHRQEALVSPIDSKPMTRLDESNEGLEGVRNHPECSEEDLDARVNDIFSGFENSRSLGSVDQTENRGSSKSFCTVRSLGEIRDSSLEICGRLAGLKQPRNNLKNNLAVDVSNTDATNSTEQINSLTVSFPVGR